jgi:hypothetical protein
MGCLWAQIGRRVNRAAPTDLVSVERVILHYREGQTLPNAPTDLVSVERVILHYEARRRA